jgi:hypothetical protein
MKSRTKLGMEMEIRALFSIAKNERPLRISTIQDDIFYDFMAEFEKRKLFTLNEFWDEIVYIGMK